MGRKQGVGAGQGGDRRPVYDSYGRLSKVPETGELEKIETQHEDNRKLIERLGADLGEQLDDGLSAWRRSVKRPGWERMLARVQSGESDGIVVWHTDRLFRQPRDLEKLIELGEKGFTVASAHGQRDLADPDDRFILRIEVAHAARSSDDGSRRIRRRFATMREQGRAQTGGPRRFGFPGLDTTPSGPDGERLPVPAEQVERERQAIRDAAAGILSGVSVAQVARDWNAAGLRSVPGGREFVQNTVRETLKRPALGGIIVHEGKPVGRMNEEPILDERTFERLQAFFAGRKRGRVAGERYLGSGILRCGVCQNKLTAQRQSKDYADGGKRATYLCSKQRRGCGRVYADVRQVDQELYFFTVQRLSDPRHAQALTAAHSRVEQRLMEVTQEIADCEELQHAMSDRLGRRQITLDEYDKFNEPLQQDLARLTAERDSLTVGSPQGPAEALSVEDLSRQWEKGGVAEKRTMLGQALGRDRLLINPSTKTGKRAFDRNRIRLRTPDSDTDSDPNTP